MKSRETIVGRMAIIRVDGEIETGNVVDVDSAGNPKRIRLQTGRRKGEVVFPSEYTFMEWQ